MQKMIRISDNLHERLKILQARKRKETGNFWTMARVIENYLPGD